MAFLPHSFYILQSARQKEKHIVNIFLTYVIGYMGLAIKNTFSLMIQLHNRKHNACLAPNFQKILAVNLPDYIITLFADTLRGEK